MDSATEALQIHAKMHDDHLAAQRMAIAWLMARLCPEDANEWLTLQRAEIRGSKNLEEVEVELGLIQEDLQECLQHSKNAT